MIVLSLIKNNSNFLTLELLMNELFLKIPFILYDHLAKFCKI